MNRNKPIRLAIWFLLGFAASANVYILAVTENDTWVDQALDSCLFAAVAINIVVYVLATVRRDAILLGLNIAFSVVTLLAFILAVISSFPGTGGRFGNHNADVFAWTGLANFLVAVAVARSDWLAAFTMAALAFPVTCLTAYLVLALPLQQEIQSADLASQCFLMTPSYPMDITNAIRITSGADLRLGILIGEHSPRVMTVSGEDAQIWHYAARRFSQPFKLTKRPKNCELPEPASAQ